jgi:hypothetical protein
MAPLLRPDDRSTCFEGVLETRFQEVFMETAKVDIKKLQLLSDRINQCIDALNQVRLSVHGLAQSGPFTGAQQGLGAQTGFGIGAPGLSHTTPGIGGSAGINPYAQGINPYAQFGGFSGQQGGFGGFPGPQGGMSGNIGTGGAFGGSMGFNPLLGLSHTNPEATEAYKSTWNDPYLAARVSQTFPYLQFAVPPVVSLY